MHGGVSFSRKVSKISNGSCRNRKSKRGKAFISAQSDEKLGRSLTISMRISVGRWHRRESFEVAIWNTGGCFGPSVWSTKIFNPRLQMISSCVMESERKRTEDKRRKKVVEGVFVEGSVPHHRGKHQPHFPSKQN